MVQAAVGAMALGKVIRPNDACVRDVGSDWSKRPTPNPDSHFRFVRCLCRLETGDNGGHQAHSKEGRLISYPSPRANALNPLSRHQTTRHVGVTAGSSRCQVDPRQNRVCRFQFHQNRLPIK
ncbi:hypothetical protein RRG08_013070 [Elysia crispata]|uniref:Uncharacterized protein n=1 Tax=Elysia crispata TaxID=231223 RepID=A0AAE1DQB4_9GAST|nr:hypothetical protein RRG08_013070 [Elysia crispata]